MKRFALMVKLVVVILGLAALSGGIASADGEIVVIKLDPVGSSGYSATTSLSAIAAGQTRVVITEVSPGTGSHPECNTTYHRNRMLMDFARPWSVHDMEPTSQEAQGRNQGHANEQRGHKTEKNLAIHAAHKEMVRSNGSRAGCSGVGRLRMRSRLIKKRLIDDLNLDLSLLQMLRPCWKDTILCPASPKTSIG